VRQAVFAPLQVQTSRGGSQASTVLHLKTTPAGAHHHAHADRDRGNADEHRTQRDRKDLSSEGASEVNTGRYTVFRNGVKPRVGKKSGSFFLNWH
jgi:hypothetical protein